MMNKRLQLTINDLVDGIGSFRTWLLLGWYDISVRYRQSILGPFWITLSLMVRIYTMGFLYSYLFHTSINRYFPSLALGILVWSLIAGLINEGTSAFVDSSSFLTQMKIPFSIFILRSMVRNMILFAHNLLAVIPVLIYFHVHIDRQTLWLIPGIFFIAFNGFFFGFIVAIIGARFVDIQELIKSLMMAALFLTPVMWTPHLIPARLHWVVAYNPFAQFIAIVRAPLLGEPITLTCMMMVSFFTIAGIVLLLPLFYCTRHRIVYWL